MQTLRRLDRHWLHKLREVPQILYEDHDDEGKRSYDEQNKQNYRNNLSPLGTTFSSKYSARDNEVATPKKAITAYGQKAA
jgi:hypothetical protein